MRKRTTTGPCLVGRRVGERGGALLWRKPQRVLPSNSAELVPAAYDSENVVSQTFASWNQIAGWLRRLAGLRDAA